MATKYRVAAVAVALTAAVLPGALGAPMASASAAVSASITPSHQSAASGQVVVWNGRWGPAGHRFDVVFKYGDGGKATISNTTATGQGFKRSFSTCTGKTYTQLMTVTDRSTTTTITVSATTTVARGNAC